MNTAAAHNAIASLVSFYAKALADAEERAKLACDQLEIVGKECVTQRSRLEQLEREIAGLRERYKEVVG